MYKVICVTNRNLCSGDEREFLQKISDVVDSGVKIVVLREKDLDDDSYENLATKVIDICHKKGVSCYLHSHFDVAAGLNPDGLHLPLGLFKEICADDVKRKVLSKFDEIGTSCHSVDDVLRAKELGATYVFAGHIFDTDCKKELPGRGLEFLSKVTESVDIPVYAIGGISPENVELVIKHGAKGACVMSGFMQDEPMKFE